MIDRTDTSNIEMTSTCRIFMLTFYTNSTAAGGISDIRIQTRKKLSAFEIQFNKSMSAFRIW